MPSLPRLVAPIISLNVERKTYGRNHKKQVGSGGSTCLEDRKIQINILKNQKISNQFILSTELFATKSRSTQSALSVVLASSSSVFCKVCQSLHRLLRIHFEREDIIFFIFYSPFFIVFFHPLFLKFSAERNSGSKKSISRV